jgi:hypothetical protein
MKICTKCKIEKDIVEFYKKSNRNSSYCKKCFDVYCMERWKERKNKAIAYKGSKCIDCSIGFPEHPRCVFDFHHLDPSLKDMDWKKLRQCSWDKVVSELDKCVLLCSNCHRIRHSDCE